MNGLPLGATPMSLREKVAQLLFVRIGSNMPPVRRVEAYEAEITRLLDDCPVGGLVLFNGGPDTRAVLDRLQAISEIPLLVGSDIERGVGQQVKGFTLFPHAMALARADAGFGFFLEAITHEARSAGIHIVFGPVADVITNPHNPIITIRAFSEDCEEAAALTAQYVKHCEESGLLTTAKHFPGHGDTQLDSHNSLPTVHKTLDELRECELLPFQAAIDSGCSLVMTAHVAFPQIDPSGLPATLSPILLTDLLRDEMGFDGVVCTDSLLMSGVREQFATEGEIALRCFEAGVDVLLDLHDPRAVLDGVVSAVDRGKLPESRIDESLARVMRLKEKLFGQPLPDLPMPKHMPATMTLGQLFSKSADDAAARAIEMIGDESLNALPFNPESPLVAILLKPFDTAIDPPEQPLAAALRERFDHLTYVQLGPSSQRDAYDAAAKLARSAEQLLVAMVVRPAAWHAFGLRPEQKAFVEQILQERSDVVIASLGVPSVLEDYPTAAARICTYSDVPASQKALADLLLK